MKPQVERLPNGRVQVRTGKVELGQGLHTALAQIVAENPAARVLICGSLYLAGAILREHG